MSAITINGVTIDPLRTRAHAAAFETIARPEQSAYLLVQMTGPLTASERSELQELGFEPLEHVPVDTYIGRRGEAKVVDIRALGFVTWVGSYLKGFKIHPTLLEDGRRRMESLDFMVKAEAGQHPVAPAPGDLEVDVLAHEGIAGHDLAAEVAVAAGLPPESVRSSAGKLRLSISATRVVRKYSSHRHVACGMRLYSL